MSWLLRVSVSIFLGLTDRPINLIYRVSPRPLTSSTGLLSNNKLLRLGTIGVVPLALVLQLLSWQDSSSCRHVLPEPECSYGRCAPCGAAWTSISELFIVRWMELSALNRKMEQWLFMERLTDSPVVLFVSLHFAWVMFYVPLQHLVWSDSIYCPIAVFFSCKCKTHRWNTCYSKSGTFPPQLLSLTVSFPVFHLRKKKIGFAPAICNSSIHVSSPLEQIDSPLCDLHWTSVGFRPVIFRSLLCLVWMPVETLIQPWHRALIWYPEQVLRILFYSTFSLPEAPEQSSSCHFLWSWRCVL